MDCFLTLLSRFHISAAMALATVAFLAVPEGAFADAGTMLTCANKCKTDFGTGNSHYWSCMANCCNTDDKGDENCCSTYCDAGDPNCIPNCELQTKADCKKGNSFCVYGSKATCEASPTDCWGSTSLCNCTWSGSCSCF